MASKTQGAARTGDNHECKLSLSSGTGIHVGGAITVEGTSKVFINKSLAAVQGDICICPEGGPNKILKGSASVYLGNKAAARVGDQTSHGAGSVLSGSSNVFIGG